jgi:hypothetical protein
MEVAVWFVTVEFIDKLSQLPREFGEQWGRGLRRHGVFSRCCAGVFDRSRCVVYGKKTRGRSIYKRASWSMSHSNQDAQQGFQKRQDQLFGIALACIGPKI